MKSSTLAGGLLWLPVSDEDLVSAFLLLDNCSFLIAQLLDRVVPGRARGRAAAGRCAGGELELATLVRDEAGPREGVVLAAGDEMPAHHDHLAGDGHHGD